MLFTQIEFYFFLAAIFAAILVCPSHWGKKLILLAGSYYFYAYWDWRFAGLLLGCTTANYWLAGRMDKANERKSKKRYVTASIACSLGVLGFFKYFNFFLDTFKAALGYTPNEAWTLNIILPIGISFYTFQTLSYTIDVYRGRLRHCGNFWDFALYVAFFPQLVAGPIVRAADFLPQLQTSRKLTWNRAYWGFEQFVFGLFKKVFIADRLAQFVDPAFENAAALSGGTLWLVMLAYAIQIYCDFSGYSDMAIGIARALGYDLPRNFKHPYVASSVQDFWRRWHISLSTWLRDYLYIPLGGNRKNPVRTYVNLMLTMLLGGLWHGASWTFVFWGAWHGLALCLNRAFPVWQRAADSSSFWKKVTAWIVTFLIVLIGWIFFRAPDFNLALTLIGRMFTLSPGVEWYQPFAIGTILALAVHHSLVAGGRERWFELAPDNIATPAVLFTMIWLVLAFYPQGFQPFIYFQF